MVFGQAMPQAEQLAAFLAIVVVHCVEPLIAGG